MFASHNLDALQKVLIAKAHTVGNSKFIGLRLELCDVFNQNRVSGAITSRFDTEPENPAKLEGQDNLVIFRTLRCIDYTEGEG